ncbi:hypothetical protein ABEY48_04515 [Bacillus mycoides]
MIFGYARVSSFDQNLDSQIEQLRNAKGFRCKVFGAELDYRKMR